ncbi:MAG: hypothetical protein KJ947_10365 [Alphaproteobacteria bacterium]|nr:hypothetical protein [Alphaproteobacteria bacterium]MBU1549962.1 hypothetical protein [Alphaproteobacteria bacterium]MBU2336582.1 hypothetical protein [Alphaproteobacteria bacterium]MBU2387315.1 hypothetical protein [Alphaproteobacteria bacterium]
MIFVTHNNDHVNEKVQANSLRHYIREKAAGRKAPENVYRATHTKGVVGLVRYSGGESDDKVPQRFRQPGPWCETLGPDTSIADDHALMAYLEMKASDDPREDAHEWSRLLHEVQRSRVKALRTYRTKGFEILRRQARRQSPTTVPAATAKALVSSKYAKRGDGVRPLKLPKTQN